MVTASIMAAADSVAAITKLAKRKVQHCLSLNSLPLYLVIELSEVVASVKAKEVEYNDIDRFASAKDGLVRVFQMNQYAECFRCLLCSVVCLLKAYSFAPAECFGSLSVANHFCKI